MTEEHAALVNTAGGDVQFSPAGHQPDIQSVKAIIKIKGCWYNESSLCFFHRVTIAQVTTTGIHLL